MKIFTCFSKQSLVLLVIGWQEQATANKSPTPVADKKLVPSRRSTRRQEAQGKDGDTNVHSRVAAN